MLPAPSESTTLGRLPLVQQVFVFAVLGFVVGLLEVEDAIVCIVPVVSSHALTEEARVGHNEDDLLGPVVQLMESILSTPHNGVARVRVLRCSRGGLVGVNRVNLREVYLREKGSQLFDRGADVAWLVRVF